MPIRDCSASFMNEESMLPEKFSKVLVSSDYAMMQKVKASLIASLNYHRSQFGENFGNIVELGLFLVDRSEKLLLHVIPQKPSEMSKYITQINWYKKSDDSYKEC
jgi:hypothetical protein